MNASWQRLARIILVALLAATGASRLDARTPARDAASDSTAASEVRALEEARTQALLHADTTSLSRMTADEFVEISRIGQIRTKADNLRDLASGALKIVSLKRDSVSVRVYGDVAVLRAIADNAGTYRGFPFSDRIWYTRVFVRRDGRWQAVAMQHTIIR